MPSRPFRGFSINQRKKWKLNKHHQILCFSSHHAVCLTSRVAPGRWQCSCAKLSQRPMFTTTEFIHNAFSESLTDQIPKDSNLLSVFFSFIIFHHQRCLFSFDDLCILAQRCLYITVRKKREGRIVTDLSLNSCCFLAVL